MKYSVIIPVYNGENYIERCVDSCLKIHKDIEIIIINDGSTDNTAQIIEHNYDKIDNVKLYSIDQSGLSIARNTGIEKSSGDYLLFLDADDWYKSSICELMDEDILRDIDVYFFAAQYIYEDESNLVIPQKPYPINEEKVYQSEDIWKLCNDNVIEDLMPHHAWRGIYRREFLIQNNIWFINGLIYEDNPFWFEVIKKAKKIKYTNSIYYNYYIRHDSIVNNNTNEKNIYSIFKIIERLLPNEENITDTYIFTLTKKVIILINNCEKKTNHLALDALDDNKIIDTKKKLIKKIDKLCKADKIEFLIVKYKLISNIVLFLGLYNKEMLAYCIELRNTIITYFKKQMECWDLDVRGKKIGLYGNGIQSDVTVNAYNRLFGEIKSNCYYIDTYLPSYKMEAFGRDVINVKDIGKENIEQVIICSSNWHEQMKKSMTELWPQIKLFDIYEECKESLYGVFNNNYLEIFLKLDATKNKKRIILLDTPEYSNIGDHIIALAELNFFANLFPEYELIEITNVEYAFYKCRLEKQIKEDDIIVITGGGFFGTLWKEYHYDEALDALERYSENKIIIMPQSVFFIGNSTETYIKKSVELLNNKNVTIFCREQFSVETLIKIGIKDSNIKLVPDIALYLNYNNVNTKEEKTAIYIRGDKEGLLGIKEIQRIYSYMNSFGYDVVGSSTLYHRQIIPKEERTLVVNEKMEELSRYKVVVTDQLHCMIMCALTGTKCIGFNNISRKVEGVYDWLKGLKYVVFLEDINDFEETFNKLINMEENNNFNINFEQEWEIIMNTIANIS